VIINRVLATHFWPDENPLGKRLTMNGKPLEVIGVVGEGRFWSMTDQAGPMLFQSLAQSYRGNATLIARTAGDPLQLAPAVERIVRQLDPDLPLHNVRTMEQQMVTSPLGLMPLRMGSIIAGAQGLIAMLLAALGIFGLISFSVTRRTKEIGIRMALGANAFNTIWQVTRQSFKLTLIGLACGLLTALGLTRALARLLYGVSPTDLSVFGGVVLLISAIALLACWLPARRATRINPLDALRTE
jgi:predicted lysophospholipase L1 biosynthesis ABC-type transport system permease subunit